ERGQRQRREREDVPFRLAPHSAQVRHEPPEVLAPLLEIRVLVVARAGRREQDDVTRLDLDRRELDGARQRLRPRVLATGRFERSGELGRGLADEIDRTDIPWQLTRERDEV